MNTEIRLRTFDELLNNVINDFRVYDEEGMIEISNLIKIAQRINYDLGLRIHQTKECIIEVENHVAKLPEDFYVLDFALLLSHCREEREVNWAGRITENVSCSGTTIPTCQCLIPLTDDLIHQNPQKSYSICNSGDTCTPEWDPWFQRSCYSTCSGTNVSVFEKRGTVINEYTRFERLHIKTPKYLDPGSINRQSRGCVDEAEIKNGYLYLTGKDHGKIYLSYQGELTDQNNNLLVLDHPLCNMYYEAALKERILENLWYAGEEVETKLKYAKEETKQMRIQSLSFINMPNLSEMLQTWKMNRDMQKNRYYNYWATGVFNERYWNGFL